MTIMEVLGIAFVSFIVYIILTVLFVKVFLKNRLQKVINQLTKKPMVTVFEK